ncbi:type II secretion system protein [Tenacibaculum caenipelagi]|uniref:Prepilin-type N-terminal cleavage/methylation domain-containing protein n=1 Tax=Tenacibaculum caenipelagi TaxID=1325435 RepID=A0A4R6TBV4_9FLAO|nr:type II secretion system protein [Tenacibaculum caenipelagi]TDQ21836.1 prepilin-type N-terminal cleavage/methylation domain-containing protein [Tenacibaculum caenipelagi]
MKKIKAFTLTELLVVMVVSTIVISLAFLMLTMVRKQLNVIKKGIDKKQIIEHLDRVFWKDFNECKKVSLKNKKLFFEKDMDTVVYNFEEKIIVREKDSFSIQINHKSFYLDGLKVNNGFIDALKLVFDDTYANNTLFVYKRKDVSFYLNE